MPNRFITALAGLLFFAACRKNDHQPPPPPLSSYDVITTASLFNPVKRTYEAACFINQQRTILASGGAEQSFAYGLDKRENDLYIAGSFSNGKAGGDDDILRPCYWKNGARKDLFMTGLDVSSRCGASDLKWFNGTLFVLGDADLKPVLWRMENGHESITQFGFEQGVDGVRKTSNMQLYRDRLYIGGNQRKQVNGRTVFNAGYWTIDNADQMEFHVVEENLEFALCFSIAVSEKGIFLIGEAGTHAQPAPAVWSAQAKGRLPVSATFNPAVHRLHTGVTDSKGNLYLNNLDIQSYQPVIWKINAANAHELIKADVPAGAKGFCQSMDIRDDKLAYVYSYQLGNEFKAAYVFEGKTIWLDIYNNQASNLGFLEIFGK